MNEESFDTAFDASLCHSTREKIPEHIHPRSIQIAEKGSIPGTTFQRRHCERGIHIVARVYLRRADKHIRQTGHPWPDDHDLGHANDLFAAKIFDRPVHKGRRHAIGSRSTECGLELRHPIKVRGSLDKPSECLRKIHWPALVVMRTRSSRISRNVRFAVNR
jgi:hypothetical protein